MWRQPKAVWAVAFASVVAFMGIGLVDPILKPIADNLNASPSQVSLLFTSYMAVMGVAMLVTGVVASRIGAKRTLLFGLVIIIAGAGLAGMSDTVAEIVGWRALWGLGNALFIATALATIVSSARGSRHHSGRPVPRAAPSRPPRCRNHRAAVQLWLLHFVGVHSFPARHERPSDRADLLRLGAGAGIHLCGRRAPAAAPLRHRADAVGQPARDDDDAGRDVGVHQ